MRTIGALVRVHRNAPFGSSSVNCRRPQTLWVSSADHAWLTPHLGFWYGLLFFIELNQQLFHDSSGCWRCYNLRIPRRGEHEVWDELGSAWFINMRPTGRTDTETGSPSEHDWSGIASLVAHRCQRSITFHSLLPLTSFIIWSPHTGRVSS
jgi:hypothetical protein